jgi:hypothetical protein
MDADLYALVETKRQAETSIGVGRNVLDGALRTPMAGVGATLRVR